MYLYSNQYIVCLHQNQKMRLVYHTQSVLVAQIIEIFFTTKSFSVHRNDINLTQNPNKLDIKRQ